MTENRKFEIEVNTLSTYMEPDPDGALEKMGIKVKLVDFNNASNEDKPLINPSVTSISHSYRLWRKEEKDTITKGIIYSNFDVYCPTY